MSPGTCTSIQFCSSCVDPVSSLFKASYCKTLLIIGLGRFRTVRRLQLAHCFLSGNGPEKSAKYQKT